MKCKSCGTINAEGSTNCKKCNTMLRPKGQGSSTNGTRALLQVIAFFLGIIGVVVLLWLILHDLFHTV